MPFFLGITPSQGKKATNVYFLKNTTYCIVNNLWILYEQNEVDQNHGFHAICQSCAVELRKVHLSADCDGAAPNNDATTTDFKTTF